MRVSGQSSERQQAVIGLRPLLGDTGRTGKAALHSAPGDGPRRRKKSCKKVKARTQGRPPCLATAAEGRVWGREEDPE